jgi:photosystem II stability/assembly factor-like uncharacterized protein
MQKKINVCRRLRAIFYASVFLLGARLIGAESYDLGALKWRNVGPNRGGRSQAAAGSTRRPLEYYFGATGGGLWKTTNGGTTWVPVTDGKIHSSSVGAVAVAESNPDVVYIGMGETELRGNILEGDGVYKTADGGKTWKQVGLKDTRAIARIRVHPADPDIVYVAALGHPYGRNEERGVFRSTDGGATWKRVLYRNDRSGAVDLCLDSHNPRVLYAAIWEVYRTPWLLSSGGPGSGMFKSTDGGDTWTEITRNPGLPKGIVGKIGVSVSGADSNRVYALIEAEDGGLFQSSDAGATWTRVSADRSIRQRAFYFSRIYADPKSRDTIYVLNVEFYRSRDGGKTLELLRTPHADHHDLWIAPDNPLRLISSDDGGGSVSTDGGKTWTPERYPTAQMYHVATTRDFPYHVCGAQQDSGTACVPSGRATNMRDPDGPAGDWLYNAGGGEAGYIAPHPKDPDIFYAGDQAGEITRYDRRTGETRVVNFFPMFFSGMPASALKERLQWTFPIVFSPLDANTLYSSSQYLWKTTNEGQGWQCISPDLTRGDPKTLGDSGGPITKDQNGPEIYGTIFTIAPSHHDINTIWTGSDDGLVQVTRDGGKTWQNVTPTGLPEFSRISLIDASPHQAGGAYVAAMRYQLDDRQPYLFKTEDYGRTWSKIVAGIPNDDFVHAIRADTHRAGLLYAGTEHGVYVSFNDGAEWQSLSLNLPDVQVPDLVVEENDLVIATHGRSFYVLDDIGILRQLTPQAAKSSVYLFGPRPVIRSVNQAVIDFYLEHAADQLKIEVLDSKGQTIRTFDVSPGSERPRIPVGDETAGPSTLPARTPGSRAGMNRFIWDLRYPGSTVFPGIVLRGANPGVGPLAPPGEYQVRLVANGQSLTRSLLIRRDPRLVNVTDADLEEQFRLAIQIRDKTSQANEAVIRIRAIKDQLEKRAVPTKAAGIANATEDLKLKLSQIEEEIYQVRNRSPRDTLNYPIKLNNQLAVLETWVETGDSRPTDQDYRVFGELSAQLAEILARLNQVLTNDLKKYNDALIARNLEAIK